MTRRSREDERLSGVRARLARLLARPFERTSTGEARADAVVVLGAPLRRDGCLTAVGEERVRAGVEVWKRGLARLVCLCGGRSPGAAHEEAEAEAMARRAIELGVPSELVRVEARSRSTYENAMYSARLLRAEGVERVWVVTQPFHLRRALHWFRKAGMEPLGWHIQDSIQYEDGGRAMRWVLAEYASWVRLVLVNLKLRLAGRE